MTNNAKLAAAYDVTIALRSGVMRPDQMTSPHPPYTQRVTATPDIGPEGGRVYKSTEGLTVEIDEGGETAYLMGWPGGPDVSDYEVLKIIPR